ncbi:methylation-associated defense system protein MAD7 [Nocardia nova]|uniref:methylation-associated defense system protein MAD7 n=1 Tax=Nocardia nova TaxID=37330 RepID=UPI0033EC03A2
MALDSKDRAFRCDSISRIDYKSLAMDRVLTAFLARLWHNGVPSRMSRAVDLTVDDYLSLLVNPAAPFEGFADNEDISRRWVGTHLLDLVSRGRVTESVAGPRPLHGFAYRLRNSRHSRPYGADEQLYEMLAVKPLAVRALKEFFFSDIGADGAVIPGPDIDVESQALLSMVSMTEKQAQDRPDGSTRKPLVPLCKQPAEFMADDVLRLLLHRDYMPRTVLVEHLKILLSFHLALYHLRMIKLVPAAVRSGSVDTSCTHGHRQGESCPYAVNLFVDMVGVDNGAPAPYAAKSAAIWYGRVPQFVRGTFAVQKLVDFAADLAKRGKPSKAGSRNDVSAAAAISLLADKHKKEREAFFDMRVRRILDDEEEPLAPELQTIVDLGLNHFETYLELIMHYRSAFQRKYLVACLDSLLMKNRPGQIVAQPKAGARRFVLDSRLLEVLLQVSLVEQDETTGRMRTRPRRVDEVLDLLRARYGLHIDRLPNEDGFAGADVPDQAALRVNSAAFIDRLREIGYYRDLSDAYLTQTITPRFTIGADGDGAERSPQ